MMELPSPRSTRSIPRRGRVNTVLLLCALSAGTLILVQAGGAPAPSVRQLNDSPVGADAFGIRSNTIARERRRIGADPATANGLPGDLQPTGPLSDISQRGITLGIQTAHTTLTVYASPATPEFGHFMRDGLPRLVSRYVRPGLLQIRLHTIAGPRDKCSVAVQPTTACTFAETAQALSFENKMWTFLAVVHGKQGGVAASPPNQTTLRHALTTLGIQPARITAVARTRSALDAVAGDLRDAKHRGVAGPVAFVLDPPGVRTPPAKLPGTPSTTELVGRVDRAVSLPG
jgi:hypothetical protein